jgi:MFS family permease
MIRAHAEETIARPWLNQGSMGDGEESVEESDCRKCAPALPLGVTVLILFFTYWCVDIVAPALPTIQGSLSLSATGAGLVFSVFFAGRLVTNLPAAWIVERSGPKLTASLGAGALLIGSLLAASASSQALLLPARGIQGAGVAFLATAGLLSVLRALPGGGSAMTAFNISSGIGSSVGLLTGGFLATEVGWRAVFLVSGIVSGALLIASVAVRSEAAPDRTSRVATPAASRRSPSSALELTAIAANLLVYANYALWVVSLPLLGAVKFGFDANQVGLLLLFVNVVHLLSALPVGRIIRKTGAPWTLAAGFGIVGLGAVMMPLAPTAAWLALPLLLYAIGQVAGNSSAGDMILRLGGGGGRAVGAVRLSSDVGMVAGPVVVGLVTDASGVEAPFLVLGAVALAAMLTMLAIAVRSGKGVRSLS